MAIESPVPPPVVAEARHDEILVVDDAPADRLAISAVLEPLGVRPVTAPSGDVALRLLGERDFTLLLLDVNMPAMNGLELARRIRDMERSRRIPIIFITAYDREDRQILAGYELGAVDFLFKPVVPEILRAKASVFIDLARQTELVREHERRESARDGAKSVARTDAAARNGASCGNASQEGPFLGHPRS